MEDCGVLKLMIQFGYLRKIQVLGGRLKEVYNKYVLATMEDFGGLIHKIKFGLVLLTIT